MCSQNPAFLGRTDLGCHQRFEPKPVVGERAGAAGASPQKSSRHTGIGISPEDSAAIAAIAPAIEVQLEQIDYGVKLAEEGVTAVWLDEQGCMIETRPDGTTTEIDTSGSATTAESARRGDPSIR